MSRRALLLIPQSPFDSASGAAISERITCDMLAKAGWHVRVVAATATECHRALDHRAILQAHGVEPELRGSTLEFRHRNVEYRLLETGDCSIDQARVSFADKFEEAIESEIRHAPPDLVITYGSSERERLRRARLRASGARVIFSMHNSAYSDRDAFAHTDAIITPSRFVSLHYARSHGVKSIPLPVPMGIDEISAPVREPVFCTLINPSRIKGVDLFIRVVRKVPEVDFLAVESRSSREEIAKAAARARIDIGTMKNLFLASNTQNAASIYAVTKTLLMPSLMEASGRSAVEAQLNGIPVVASDRGGLPETVGAGGIILRADAEDEACVESWADTIRRLHNDETWYANACRSAALASARHRSGEVERERVEAFERIAFGARLKS